MSTSIPRNTRNGHVPSVLSVLTFMLDHAVGSIFAIPVIGVIFSADLRVAVRGWPVLRSTKCLTFTLPLRTPTSAAS